MRKSFYPKMAWSGISHNKKFYIPYFFTCIAMVMMFYIIDALSVSSVLVRIPGGETMQGMLNLGKWIIGLFTLIFLFYTNSFLNKRRSREYGLYNVLGMDKRNLAHIHFWETAITAGISLVAGLIFGIVFSKLAELWMVNILNGQTDFKLRIEGLAIRETILVFLVIFILILLNALRKMTMASPIELLRREHTGEKAPKGNWLLALVGIVALAIAYGLAVTIEDPVEALTWFFAAVILVIVATYMLFIAGSVTLCRILQKNKGFYYRKQHFISIASMSYRMKRNGAGLASICVLSTMVLVMLSSTICLYAGVESIMHERYPRDLSYEVHVSAPKYLNEENEAGWRQLMDETLQESHLTASDVLEYTSAFFYGKLEDHNFRMKDELIDMETNESTAFDVDEVYVAPLSVYNRVTGEKETLDAGEALVAVYGGSYENNTDTLSIHNDIHLNVKKVISNFKAIHMDGAVSTKVYYIFVPDFDEVAEKLAQYNTAQYMTENMENVYFKCYYGCNLDGSDDAQMAAEGVLNNKFAALDASQQEGINYVRYESYAFNKESFYGTFGGLLVLGILLGIVFVFAAILIMYYKQVTEGYEDQSGFVVMQKVGMTKKDIRQSINSQILIVFFAPLLLAGLHLLFAFPMISKLLLLFGLNRTQFLAMVALGCYLMFAVCYIIVYKMTSGVYYRIVSVNNK